MKQSMARNAGYKVTAWGCEHGCCLLLLLCDSGFQECLSNPAATWLLHGCGELSHLT